jgi:hypothetical protein
VPEPGSVLEELRAGVSRLAADLYRIETEPELKALSEARGLTGRSAAVVADAPARISSLWDRYSMLTDVIERLESALAADDTAAADELVGPAAVPLADGPVGALVLLEALQAEAGAILAAGEQLSAAWRTVVPRLDAAVERLTRVSAAAAAIGVSGEPTLGSARRLVDQAGAVAHSDPLGADASAAEEAVTRAERRIGDLTRQRSALPDRLADAERLVDELDRAATEGREALSASRAKILRPGGLLEPIDPAAYDSGPQGLRVWLARLRELADEGSWLAAGEGLARWEEVGGGWLANARAVLAANRGPLDRRGELRGLLAAYSAKAAATGQAEEPALSELYDAAHEALHRAPCDLDPAAELVTRYGAAVRSGDAAEGAAR